LKGRIVQLQDASGMDEQGIVRLLLEEILLGDYDINIVNGCKITRRATQ